MGSTAGNIQRPRCFHVCIALGHQLCHRQRHFHDVSPPELILFNRLGCGHLSASFACMRTFLDKTPYRQQTLHESAGKCCRPGPVATNELKWIGRLAITATSESVGTPDVKLQSRQMPGYLCHNLLEHMDRPLVEQNVALDTNDICRRGAAHFTVFKMRLHHVEQCLVELLLQLPDGTLHR